MSSRETSLSPRELLHCITKAQQDYIDNQDASAAFGYLLSRLLAFTGSEYGFVGRVIEDEQGPYLKVLNIENTSTNPDARAWFDKNAVSGLEFRNLQTLFGRVLVTGGLLLHNASVPKARVPSGHPPIRSFAGIPLYCAGRFVGLAGLANRDGGYEEGLIEALEPLLITTAQLIHAATERAQREEAQRQLAENERRLKYALSGSSDGVWDWDMLTGDVFFSARWQEMLGYADGELLGRFETFESLIHPDDVAKIEEKVARHLSGEDQQYIAEFRMRHKDGGWRWILARGRLTERTPDGRPWRFVGTHIDTTQQREQAEQLRRAKEQAEAATRAKAIFLANMSHEIRTPLNGITSAVNLLKRTSVTEEQASLLRLVQTASDGLIGIVNDILDHSKIEAGALALEEVSFPLRERLQDLIRIHTIAAEKKGLRLLSDLDDQLPSYVVSDPVRLQQVLNNLLSNAVKFTERGTVTLSVSVVSPPDAPIRVCFSIADTGIGIPSEVASRIFAPFSQAEASTTRRFGGTGLGLSISNRLVEMMGGALSVDSAPGSGSCFRFTLPLAACAAPTPHEPDPGADTLRGHILLVEDNPINQLLTRRLLESLTACTVDICQDGAEALQLLAQRRYALVLMDCQMPVLDGYEATRRLRASDGPNADVAVIAQTANAFVEDRAACLAAGMNDFVSKPLVPERLLAVMRRWLGRRHQAA